MIEAEPMKASDLPEDQRSAAHKIVAAIDQIVKGNFVLKQDFGAEPQWILTIGFAEIKGQSTLTSNNITELERATEMLENAAAQARQAHEK